MYEVMLERTSFGQYLTNGRARVNLRAEVSRGNDVGSVEECFWIVDLREGVCARWDHGDSVPAKAIADNGNMQFFLL